MLLLPKGQKNKAWKAASYAVPSVGEHRIEVFSLGLLKG
jgi:hypothetical protein